MSGYVDEVLADAPAGFWRLNDTAAGTFVDSSGNGHDATTHNTPTLGQAALTTYPGDAAVNFNGSYAIAPTSADFDTANQLTLEAWIQMGSSDANEREMMARDTDNSNRAALFAVVNGVIQLILIIGGTVYKVTGVTSIHDSQPHHVVATYDGATMAVYVDGALDASQPRTGNLNTPINAAVTIACRRTGNNTFNSPNSINMADVAWYTTALDATRIAAHYDAGVATYPVATAAAAMNRSARTMTATATTSTISTASATLARAARGFSASAAPVVSAAATLTRGPRTLTAERTLVKLATPWTVEKSQSLARADRGFSAVPTAQPAVEPTPDLVLVPGQILTREP